MMKRGFLLLLLAILCEVFASSMLKLSEGFTVLFPSIGVIIGYIASFLFLGLSLKEIPLSNAYAIWSGLGTALTAIVGIVIFHEEISLLKVFALVLIIYGVMLLNKAKEEELKTEREASII